MEETKFTGKSLEEALRKGDLEQSGMTLVGMVKASDKDGHVGFTRTGCESWVDIPTGMIEQAEKVGKSRCKNHSHPIFEITLAAGKDPASKILMALIGQTGAEHTPHVHDMPMQEMSMHNSPYQGAPAPGMGLDLQQAGIPEGGGYSVGQAARQAGPLGGVGGFGGGGLNAWGCWSSCCGSRCIAGRWVRSPAGHVYWICMASECTDPCTRCIWPW